MKPLHMLVALGLVAALAAAGSAAPASQPVDLLSNGGFEDGLTGWTPDAKHSLVAEKDAAHSGGACLTGEVTTPNRALFLKRRVPVNSPSAF